MPISFFRINIKTYISSVNLTVTYLVIVKLLHRKGYLEAFICVAIIAQGCVSKIC